MVAIAASDPAAIKRFIKSLVQGSSFDGSEFLQETASLPSEELLRAMSSIADELQAELTSLVSGEFENFMRLFGDIGGLGEEEITLMENKLRYLKKAITQAQGSYHQELTLIEARRQACLQNRRELGKTIFLKDLAEDLMLLEQILGSENESLFKVTVARLQLATVIFTRLQAQIQKGSDVMIPELLATKLAQLSGLLYDTLDDVLHSFCQRPEMTDWPPLVDIYLQLGKKTNLVEGFKETIWEREIGHLIDRHWYEEQTKQSDGVTRACSEAFERIEKALCKHLDKWWLDREWADQLLMECSLNPLFTKLVKVLPVLFSPARPQVFHHNFTASCRFIEWLADFLPDSVSSKLDRDEAFHLYTRSWQLNVYYQLRFRDIAQQVEECLSIEISKQAIINKEGMAKLLEILIDITNKIVSEDYILRPLVPRFHRLRLQMLARVNNWLQDENDSISVEQAWSRKQFHDLLLSRMDDLIGIAVIKRYFQNDEPTRLLAINERFRNWMIQQNQQLQNHVEKLVHDQLVEMAQVWELSSKGRLVVDLLRYRPLVGTQYEELVKAVALQFEIRAISLLQQSAKAVAKHRRLKMIIKEEEEEGQEHGEMIKDDKQGLTPSNTTPVIHKEADPEKQHQLLVNRIQEEVQGFNQAIEENSNKDGSSTTLFENILSMLTLMQNPQAMLSTTSVRSLNIPPQTQSHPPTQHK